MVWFGNTVAIPTYEQTLHHNNPDFSSMKRIGIMQFKNGAWRIATTIGKKQVKYGVAQDQRGPRLKCDPTHKHNIPYVSRSRRSLPYHSGQLGQIHFVELTIVDTHIVNPAGQAMVLIGRGIAIVEFDGVQVALGLAVHASDADISAP